MKTIWRMFKLCNIFDVNNSKHGTLVTDLTLHCLIARQCEHKQDYNQVNQAMSNFS